MSITTKTLAVYQLDRAPAWLQHHSDGTDLRQQKLENSIVRVIREGGLKCIALSASILPEDGSAATCVSAISQAFAEGREHLRDWQAVAARMFPRRLELLCQIPQPNKLTLGGFFNNMSNF